MTGKDLRAMRNRLGWTQAQLATALEVTRVTIANSERRGTSLMLDLLIERARSNGRLPSPDYQGKPPESKPKRDKA